MSGVRAQIPSVGLSQINLETFYGLRVHVSGVNTAKFSHFLRAYSFRWILSDVFVSFCLP